MKNFNYISIPKSKSVSICGPDEDGEYEICIETDTSIQCAYVPKKEFENMCREVLESS